MSNQISVIAKPLKVGMFAFFVGLVTVVAAFNIDYQADNILAYIFFWLVTTAVLVVFASIAWGIWTAVHSAQRNESERT
jgi:hypothetical protein